MLADPPRGVTLILTLLDEFVIEAVPDVSPTNPPTVIDAGLVTVIVPAEELFNNAAPEKKPTKLPI